MKNAENSRKKTHKDKERELISVYLGEAKRLGNTYVFPRRFNGFFIY